MQNSSSDGDLFPLSWLTQYGYCPRRCGLLAIDQAWIENADTAAGRAQHERVHTVRTERKGGTLFLYETGVFSRRLGISGKCDCVEAHPAEDGVPLPFRTGQYRLYPIEYKHGTVRDETEYHIQLCAQAMCLEEQFGGRINRGAIFYIDAHRRDEVEFTGELRTRVRDTARAVQQMLDDQVIPRAAYGPKCKKCSMQPLCQPRMKRSSRGYCDALWAQATGEADT